MRLTLSALVVLTAQGTCASRAAAAARPNFVFITCEDISPNLSCYGDPDAITPNLDRLAKEGARFTRAFTHAPVCAPSRSGIITGQYPTTLGSHHMRSKLTRTPPLFTDDLRKAGYTVCWPTAGGGGIGKTDFNFDVPKGWVDVTADWTKRPELLKPPFFAVYNITVTHESQARATRFQYAKNTARLKPAERRDPAKVQFPPYYPDTVPVRDCVATYHDNVTAMDYLAGDVLKLLEDRKLADDTVVVFYGDHGWGLSRGKRWPYDSGLRVPFIVRWPGRVKPGSVRDDLVCFLDIAPTVLALAGAEVPARMQGRVMLGEKAQQAPKYVFGARDRMDETYDRIRTVRGERYRYIRNFEPDLPYFQYCNYMDEMPIMREWRRLAFEDKLDPTQKLFMSRTKPKEELYDLETDPHEIKNLAGSPNAELRAVRQEMSAALDRWIKDTKDLGEVPEKELIKRGVVRDVLAVEYDQRVKLHPKTPPVP
ncbi:sulfatase [Gemmata sp. JC673]|uniref:Sulfatase n=1 Tax=Gemmata algarum TaxID=2975278 RepID=A0ABU5F9B2_9BACT|nr:sulfatase [Gemmata algarum]MDY3562436.1 sulfatase [Gemmata algarum]